MKRIQPDHTESKQNPLKRAESQRDFSLRVLRASGSAGVSKLHFIHGTGPCNGRMVTQISARIVELEAEGYRFEHRHVEGSDFITFVLLSEPNHQQKSGFEQHPEPSQMGLGLALTSAQVSSDFIQFELGERNA